MLDTKHWCVCGGGGRPLNPMRSPGNTSPMQIGLTMKHFKERVQREKL